MSSEHEKKQVEVLRLIQAYRMRGHQAAQLDPLGLWQRPAPADLSINHYGLTNADLDTTFRAGDLFIGKEEASLREIHEALQQTYCRTIGSEFTHRGFRAAQLVHAASRECPWPSCVLG